ncbi:MAG: hypothetical protein IJT66_01430, partial [Clostridia bacterium]|nr:hypothetical protein [Clostridia bacterium]
MKRIGCMVLCLALLFSLAACGGTESKTPEKKVKEETVVDLGGYTFTVLDGDKAHFDPESGTALNDKTLALVKEVEEAYNCNIEVKVVDPSAMFKQIQPSIMAGDKTADLIVST